MTEIKETKLPGVGVRHDFRTRHGDLLGVITHRGGRRDLLVYDREDPDACAAVLRLDEEEGHALAELLGGTQVTATISSLQQSVPGLTIDWLPISASSACALQSIQSFGLRGQTGVSIVAIVRDGETIASPPPEFVLQPGDTAVVVGTPAGIRRAFELLQGGAPPG
jgi:TrkA domain protein